MYNNYNNDLFITNNTIYTGRDTRQVDYRKLHFLHIGEVIIVIRGAIRNLSITLVIKWHFPFKNYYFEHVYNNFNDSASTGSTIRSQFI